MYLMKWGVCVSLSFADHDHHYRPFLAWKLTLTCCGSLQVVPQSFGDGCDTKYKTTVRGLRTWRLSQD